MPGVSRIRSMNVADIEVRQIFGPAENKAQRSLGSRKPVSKPIRKAEKSTEEVEVVEDKNGRRLSPLLQSVKVPKILQRQDSLLHSSLSLSASCSSDYVSDSSPEGLQSKKRCAWVTPNTGIFLILSFRRSRF